jgi:hypothetical protein
MEAEVGSVQMNAEFYNALSELFRRGRLHKQFKDDYQTVEQLCLTLRLILDNIEKVRRFYRFEKIKHDFAPLCF